MNDPVSLLQLIIALLVVAVPAGVTAGALMRDVSRVKRDVEEHITEDKVMHESIQVHDGRLVALERDAHAARNREQAMVMQLSAMSEKIDRYGEVVIRIDERLSRDDTNPRKRGA